MALVLFSGCGQVAKDFKEDMNNKCVQLGYNKSTDWKYSDKRLYTRYAEVGDINYIKLECDNKVIIGEFSFITIEKCNQYNKWDECTSKQKYEELYS